MYKEKPKRVETVCASKNKLQKYAMSIWPEKMNNSCQSSCRKCSASTANRNCTTEHIAIHASPQHRAPAVSIGSAQERSCWLTFSLLAEGAPLGFSEVAWVEAVGVTGGAAREALRLPHQTQAWPLGWVCRPTLPGGPKLPAWLQRQGRASGSPQLRSHLK